MTYRQGDPLWGSVPIAPPSAPGKPARNLARLGCAVTATAEASARYAAVPGSAVHALNPAEILARGLVAGAFIGASAVFDKLAACGGMTAPQRERRYYTDGDDALRAAILDAFARERLAILHVDTDHSEDGIGNHFVLALGRDGDAVSYADPAPGKQHVLSLATLRGEALWGTPRKPYRVLSVLPIYPIPVRYAAGAAWDPA